MACCNGSHRGLMVAGWLCFLLAVWPHYSWIPQAGPRVERVELGEAVPVVGSALPAQAPGRRLIQLGLPCSPLFVYESRVEHKQHPSTVTITPKDGEVAVNSTTKVSGSGRITTSNVDYSFHSRLSFLSWSAGLAALAVLLHCAAGRCKSRASDGDPAAKPEGLGPEV